MKRLLIGSTMLSLALALGAAPVRTEAQTDASREAAHRKEDIAKHRQMARAHEEAAKCLESNEKESVCQARLREACKGIAVGRYCGMRHDR